MDRYFKCLKADCRRKVTPGVAYCCRPCQIAADDPSSYEIEPYRPGEHWILVHTELCEARKNERGECSELEAVMLEQR